MTQRWGVRIRYQNDSEIIYETGTNWWVADFFIHLIPQLMVDGNKMVAGTKSARIIKVM